MSRLTEAGENISETLFNALVINGLPEKYEHFIVQESFNPAANFTELRARFQNYDDSRLQRSQAEDSATAMHSGNTVHQKIKVQASQREIVLSADILAILPSRVVKEVQLSVLSARKEVTYQKHAEAQVNPQQNLILFHHIPNV